MVRLNPVARLAGAQSPFAVLVFGFGFLSPKQTQLRVILVIVFHEVVFLNNISRPPATPKRTDSTTRVLPLLNAAPLQLRLQPDRSHAPATGRAGLRNRRLCDPALGEGE
jgi:hypothetical protein